MKLAYSVNPVIRQKKSGEWGVHNNAHVAERSPRPLPHDILKTVFKICVFIGGGGGLKGRPFTVLRVEMSAMHFYTCISKEILPFLQIVLGMFWKGNQTALRMYIRSKIMSKCREKT